GAAAPNPTVFPYTTLFRSPDDLGAAFDLPVEALEGVGGPDLAPVGLGEVSEGGDLLAGRAQHVGDGRELGLEHGRDGLDLLADQDRKSTRLNSSHVKISYA